MLDSVKFELIIRTRFGEWDKTSNGCSFGTFFNGDVEKSFDLNLLDTWEKVFVGLA